MMIATTTMHSQMLPSNGNDDISRMNRPKRRTLWRPSTSHSPEPDRQSVQQPRARNRISTGFESRQTPELDWDPQSFSPALMLSTVKRTETTRFNSDSQQQQESRTRKTSLRRKTGLGSRSGEKRRVAVVADTVGQITSEIMPHSRLMGLQGKAKNAASSSAGPSTSIQLPNEQHSIKVGEGSSGTQKRSEGIPIRMRRPSSQSLMLDLDGLDLGQHPQSTPLLKPATNSPLSSSWQKESLLPSRAALSSQQPLSHHRHPSDEECNHTPSQFHDEDTFAAHLRDCEDAHDIPTVETFLQNPTKKPCEEQKAQQSNLTPDTNEYVLGGFASLGIVKTPRPPMKTSMGSDTDLTGSSSSIGLNSSVGKEDELSPWTTLKLQQRNPVEIVDILSIDEMGLHSINVGSRDDWRGTALVATGTGEGSEQDTKTEAEWSVARNQKRQRKWIVAPAAQTPERTVVVSDHITRKKNADLVSILHPNAFSGFSSFSLRFLQAGSRAPDCTIVLATPATHRRRIEEQQWKASPVSTSNLSSKGLHEEQMQSWDVGTSTTTTLDEDAWPSLRARTISTNLPPFGAPSPVLRERRLTHSKSTSTIVAPFAVEIESRRPSLGKSMSHEGLAPDFSPKPNEHAFSDPTRSYDSVQTHSFKPATAFGMKASSRSPFEDYSFDRKTSTSMFANAGSMSPSGVAPHERGPSPRSSMSAFNAVKKEARARERRSPVLPSNSAFETTSSVIKKGNVGAESSSPLAQSSTPPISGKREKRLGDWLRRKVLPVGSNLANTSSSNTTSSSLWSPPLPPAWETAKGDLYRSPRLAPQSVIEASGKEMLDYSNLAGRAALTNRSNIITDTQLKGSSPKIHASEAAAAMPPPSDILTQRRRSNSDDIVAAISEAQRKRTQALVMGNDVDIATRKARSASGNAKMIPSSTIHPEGIKQDLLSDGLPSASTSEAGHAENASVPYVPSSNQAALLEGTPKVFAPDLLGLGDVPSEAMTMIIALPLGNHTESSYASRYLRVSFVPFQVAASSSHGSEDMQLGTSNLGGSSSGGQQFDSPLMHVVSMNNQEAISPGEGASNEQSNTSSSGLNWYRRLAHAWHATPSTQSASSDDESSAYNRSPPPGMIGANTSEQLSKPFVTNDKREPFRIIAKVLANDHLPSSFGLGAGKIELDSATSSTSTTTPLTNAVNQGIPQPFSFPVILGMCDTFGRLDLIPEGWQAIGLANGPAPDSVPLNINTGIDSTTTIDVPHPLRGVADLIIAGCAACMDL
ncbi:uncharacterized protein FA14DRAFT_51553 [Meira miltonrushii]|uniref:Uncharacterized protein n=1 Tax=Meira miltonrushii TaxID=1280837 RepID=A0A316VEJ5_9BASI|nr:uncharacterized protein FA14DRAFT_51553 [Meira miltonrushii]PWN36077.1 hypothetical protein FA14DRAFT_51553 [Meira miltonrushii]